METWKKVRKWLLPAAVILLALGLVLCLIIPSFAWLKTSREAPFRLGADPVPDIALYMGVYDSGAGSYHWSQPLPMTDVRTAESFGTSIGDQVQAKAVVKTDMGIIERLDQGSLGPGNYTWYCIRVHEEEGLRFKNLKVQYAAVPFQFWGTKWSAAGNQGKIELLNEDPAVKPILTALFQDTNPDTMAIPNLMQVAAPAAEADFVTTKAPDQLQAMPAVSQTAGYAGKYQEAQPIPMPVTTDGEGYYTVSSVDSQGYYYIYFRMAPNLNAYYNLVNDLYLYMPCYLSFDGMTISIDLKK